MDKLKKGLVSKDERHKIDPLRDGLALTTLVALAGGSVLDYLEKNGPSKLLEISHQLSEWPAALVLVSVGFLIGEHLVSVKKGHRTVIVESVGKDFGRPKRFSSHMVLKLSSV